ncbi:MAG: hypothetical protein ACXVJ1_07765 [Candidatus Angelobacter sp.]
MNWLQSHAYIATWLGPMVAILVFLIRGFKTDFKETDWSRTLLNIAFLTCLAVAFTPAFDSIARTIAQTTLPLLIIFLIVDRIPRQG